MPASVVIGTQWGDEGKGKATDYLADRMDFVVRYQGGNNAGHTILAEGHTLKLQLIPSGILYPHITSVIADGVVVDPRVLLEGRNVLLEGAQGTMLDLDHGTYPFVTSSNPLTGYALASVGIGPQHVDRVIGVTKAYVTRVGAGPFPTEDRGPDGDRLGERGNEFGTVTGRKRRCGWFDAVILRYAARVNGLTELFLTKLDVLSGFPVVRVCTAYRADGQIF